MAKKGCERGDSGATVTGPRGIVPRGFGGNRSNGPGNEPGGVPSVRMLLTSIFKRPSTVGTMLRGLRAVTGTNGVHTVRVVLSQDCKGPGRGVSRASNNRRVTFTKFSFLRGVTTRSSGDTSTGA